MMFIFFPRLRRLLFGPAKPNVSHIQFSRPSEEDSNSLGSESSGGGRKYPGRLSGCLDPGIHMLGRPTRRKTKEERSLYSRRSSRGQYGDRREPRSFNATEIALFSRLVVLLIQIFGRMIIPAHINDGFKTPRTPGTFLDTVVEATLGGFSNWDGEYFLHLSTMGYTHLNTIAFFPLFPTVIGYPAIIFHYFTFGCLALRSVALIIGWGMNTWLFVKSAGILEQLTLHMDHNMSSLIPSVTYLFCFNPASIFFSAFYTESMFTYFTLNVLLELYKKQTTRAILFAAAGAACRSNGLLNFGLIGAFILRNAVSEQRTNPSVAAMLYEVTARFGECILGFLPFIYFQIFCVWKFCRRRAGSESVNLPEFCNSLVLPYSYIQADNWGVGFLRYFEVRQIPNFLLAAPVLSVALYEASKRARFYAKHILAEGFVRQVGRLPNLAIACHALFLVFFCFFFVHVQVSTRMILSSCPYLFVYIAKGIRTETYKFRTLRIDWLPYSVFIHAWFGLYFVIGSLAFSLGLPWT